MLDYWNRRDADDLVALFDADGYLVGFDGSPMNGQVEPEPRRKRRMSGNNHVARPGDAHPSAATL
jgi:hypothetical protein